jgi:glycosyltransferase involved in cell wall biosynthesis
VLPVIAAWLAAKLKRRALVVTWQEFFGPEWDNYLGRRLGPFARRLERLALSCSPIAIAGSPQTRDRLLAAGFPNERLRYIPNGIATKEIEQATPFPGGADLVYAGRLTPHKRVDLGIRALQVIRAMRPHTTMWIIGDGPERSSLQNLVDEMKLNDAVTFHGFLPDDGDVFSRLKSCRVAVLPSAREGFGLTAVQAWACGLPVVVCDDVENATAGLVTDARLGSVVPAKVATIASATLQWLTEPGDTAFRIAHARENYDLDAMVAAVRAVYEEAFARLR